MRSRARCFLDKSLDAMLAAIELYNKPRFPYRDEAFAVLAINSWELLLKARLLQLNKNKLGTITAKERRKNNDGSTSTKLYIKRNRAGNPMSIGLFAAYDRLTNDFADTIPASVRLNIEALCEIRDNAVHFVNDHPETDLRVNEIGSAATRNYLVLSRQWFAVDFTDHNLRLMPLTFLRGFNRTEGVSISSEERKFVDYIATLVEADPSDDDFNVSLYVDVKMKRSKDGDATRFRVTNDPDAVEVQLNEENIRETYPWDYKILTERLQRRYSDFKCNSDYHSIRKELENDSRYANERVLDPGNPRSAAKTFFSPNILREFDEHYTRG